MYTQRTRAGRRVYCDHARTYSNVCLCSGAARRLQKQRQGAETVWRDFALYALIVRMHVNDFAARFCTMRGKEFSSTLTARTSSNFLALDKRWRTCVFFQIILVRNHQHQLLYRFNTNNCAVSMCVCFFRSLLWLSSVLRVLLFVVALLTWHCHR